MVLGKSIKNMILNMGNAKRKPKEEANLQNDEVLGELLGEISSSIGKSEPKKPRGMIMNGSRNQPKSSPHANPFAITPKSTGLKKVVKKPETPKVREVKEEEVVTPSQTIEDDFTEDMFDEPMEYDDGPTPTQKIEDDEEDQEASKVKVEEKENLAENRGFKATKLEESAKPQIPMMMIKSTVESSTPSDVKIDPGKLPLVQNESGDKVLRMYWLDAFDDYYKHPGTVWLFGKVYIESAKSYVSCCVTVKNIERQVFFCPKEECTVADVYSEFAEKISNQLKIMDFRAGK